MTRFTIFTILTIVSFTKASAQILEKFEFSGCIKECIGDSTKIDGVVQTNNLIEISLTAYSNCIGNLKGKIKLTNDTLNLIYLQKGTEIFLCDCIFKLKYAIRGLKTLDKKKVKINGETLDKINERYFPKIDTAEYVFTTVENTAQFPGGHIKFLDYVHKNLKYPKSGGGLSGRVYISFVINRDGSIDDNTVMVVKGLNESLDNEAIRLLKECPNWIPATIKGRTVKQKYILPITVDIQKDN